jgi:integrase
MPSSAPASTSRPARSRPSSRPPKAIGTVTGDATMILVAFRHGLRAAEVCDLRWDQIDFSGTVLHVRRVKNGTPSTHPLLGDGLRTLRRLQREKRDVALRLRQ